jgi:hypothetical protein
MTVIRPRDLDILGGFTEHPIPQIRNACNLIQELLSANS